MFGKILFVKFSSKIVLKVLGMKFVEIIYTEKFEFILGKF